MQDLSRDLASAARAVAEPLSRAGHRAWIVGGAVRDLALRRDVQDVDMASDATPADVERIFRRTIPLGRSFGTLVVHVDGHDVEHTTFRSESGYTDARRPDDVAFGTTPEVDARRRDFTCNALYLDPLRDEVLDPSGGLADLAAGRLVCVGDARQRFAEDGLRIVRLARFAGQLRLEPTPATVAAARAELEALRGVSRERIFAECASLVRRGGGARALSVLHATGALDVVLPAVARGLPERLAVLARLPDAPGDQLGFAAWLAPEPVPLAEAEAALVGLRPPSALRDHVLDAWRLVAEIRAQDRPPRSTRVRWFRRAGVATALALGRAQDEARGADPRRFVELARERDALSAAELAPPALVTARDLVERGLEPGPAFGAILRDVETLQLDGRLVDRAAALAWLDARGQDGGNARRNA